MCGIGWFDSLLLLVRFETRAETVMPTKLTELIYKLPLLCSALGSMNNQDSWMELEGRQLDLMLRLDCNTQWWLLVYPEESCLIMRQDLVKLLKKKDYTKISGGFLILVVARLIVLSSHLPLSFCKGVGIMEVLPWQDCREEETKGPVQACCGSTCSCQDGCTIIRCSVLG